jgi:excinuclease ABC subunit A
VKLARELSRRATGRTLYVLDEPSVGLHVADVHKLIEVLQTLVSTGNSVLIIEHNMDIIKVADHMIDLGPDGGDRGGQIIAAGTPEEVMQEPRSYTGSSWSATSERTIFRRDSPNLRISGRIPLRSISPSRTQS